MSRTIRCVLLRAAGLVGVALSGGVVAAPSSDDMAHCASIDAPTSRLACYDNLAHRAPVADSPAAAPAPSAAAVPVPAPTPTPSPTATRAPAPAVATVTPAPAVLSTPSPTAPAPADASTFGLSKAQLHVAPEGPNSITARVTKVSQDALGQFYILLDDGQTWMTTEQDLRIGPGESVTIKRASLGSFLLLTTTKHSYRVRRTH